jgi:hypothetical protein
MRSAKAWWARFRMYGGNSNDVTAKLVVWFGCNACCALVVRHDGSAIGKRRARRHRTDSESDCVADGACTGRDVQILLGVDQRDELHRIGWVVRFEGAFG